MLPAVHAESGLIIVCANVRHGPARVFLQVALKYMLGTGKVIIPRTSSPEHLQQLLPQQLQQLRLDDDDLLLLGSLNGQLESARP